MIYLITKITSDYNIRIYIEKTPPILFLTYDHKEDAAVHFSD